jgi:hypothetical protein
MTRRIRILTVVGVALVLVPSAFAKGERFQEAPQWHQALMARSEGMNQRYIPAESTPVVVGERFQQPPQWHQALTARGEALNREHRLGEYAFRSGDARDRTPTQPAAQTAVATHPDRFIRGDDFVRLDVADVPSVSVAKTDSGREIDVPQIGIGLGLGVLLALGLYLAVRLTRVRPIAH